MVLTGSLSINDSHVQRVLTAHQLHFPLLDWFYTFCLFLKPPPPSPSPSLLPDHLVCYLINKTEAIRRDFLHVPPTPLYPPFPGPFYSAFPPVAWMDSPPQTPSEPTLVLCLRSHPLSPVQGLCSSHFLLCHHHLFLLCWIIPISICTHPYFHLKQISK